MLDKLLAKPLRFFGRQPNDVEEGFLAEVEAGLVVVVGLAVEEEDLDLAEALLGLQWDEVALVGVLVVLRRLTALQDNTDPPGKNEWLAPRDSSPAARFRRLLQTNDHRCASRRELRTRELS